MENGSDGVVFSIAGAATVIDAGNTLVLHLSGPDEREVVLLLPYKVAETLAERITRGLGLASEERWRWLGASITRQGEF